MKLSAYVPDGLWARVRERFPGARPSPTAQLALRRLVEPRSAVAHVQGQVSEARQRDYDEGYEAGLALCDTLVWADLERLAAANWPVDDLAPRTGAARSLAHRSGVRDALRDVWLEVARTVGDR